jgi:hypothetical protein
MYFIQLLMHTNVILFANPLNVEAHRRQWSAAELLSGAALCSAAA